MYLYSSYDAKKEKPNYSWEAFLSAISVRRVSDAPIRLVTNNTSVKLYFESHDHNPFTEIIVRDDLFTAKAQKIAAIRDHSFGRTIFLDTHAIVFSDLSEVFKMQEFEVAGVRPPWRVQTSKSEIDSEAETAYLKHLNTGVLFFTDALSQNFFDTWAAAFKRRCCKLGANAQDQPAFAEAASAQDVDILSLPENFNFRAHIGGRISGKCHVFHSHLWDDVSRLAGLHFKKVEVLKFLDKIDHTINCSLDNRIVLPFKQRRADKIHTVSSSDTEFQQKTRPHGEGCAGTVAERLKKAEEIDLVNFQKVNTVVDVGVGYTGTGFLTSVFASKNFVCIEPNKNLRGAVERHYPKGRSQFFFIGVGARAETRVFYSGGDDPNKGGIFLPNKFSPKGAGEGDAVDVEIRPLDAIEEEFEYAGPYLLKIDAEGAELDILKGATRFLRNVEALIIEVNFLRRYRGSYGFGEMIAFLYEHGFEPVDIVDLPSRSLVQMPIRRLDMLFRRKAYSN
jgi:FkbM family methyltransferase